MHFIHWDRARIGCASALRLFVVIPGVVLSYGLLKTWRAKKFQYVIRAAPLETNIIFADIYLRIYGLIFLSGSTKPRRFRLQVKRMFDQPGRVFCQLRHVLVEHIGDCLSCYRRSLFVAIA
jgi:hypothetical protein